MTVKELIEKLSNVPQDAKVTVYDARNGGTSERVVLVNDGDVLIDCTDNLEAEGYDRAQIREMEW